MMLHAHVGKICKNKTGIEKRNRRTGIGKAVAKDRVRLRKSVKSTKKTYEKIAR